MATIRWRQYPECDARIDHHALKLHYASTRQIKHGIGEQDENQPFDISYRDDACASRLGEEHKPSSSPAMQRAGFPRSSPGFARTFNLCICISSLFSNSHRSCEGIGDMFRFFLLA